MGMNPMIQFIRQMSGKLNSTIYAGVQNQSDPKHISFLRQLQKEMKKEKSLDQPLESLEVVVFDLETTGFSPEKGDRILSIGAIKMRGEQILEEETFYSLIQTDAPIPEHIITLTGITNEQLQYAKPATEVLYDFFNYIQNSVLVAHHSKHEQSFMHQATWQVMRTNFEHRIIDTSFLIRLSHPESKSLPLEDVCDLCGVNIIDRHNALGDARMTAYIWSYYLKEAKEMGFHNLREVYEYIATIR